MGGLLKLVSLLAGSLLFLDTIHAIDLGSWGLGDNLKDHIDTALKGKELVAQAVDFLPGMNEGTKASIAIESAAAAPGIFLILIKGLSSIIKFAVSLSIAGITVSYVFAYAEENRPAVEAFRQELQESAVPDHPIQTIAVLIGRGTQSVVRSIQGPAHFVPIFPPPPNIPEVIRHQIVQQPHPFPCYPRPKC